MELYQLIKGLVPIYNGIWNEYGMKKCLGKRQEYKNGSFREE